MEQQIQENQPQQNQKKAAASAFGFASSFASLAFNYANKVKQKIDEAASDLDRQHSEFVRQKREQEGYLPTLTAQIPPSAFKIQKKPSIEAALTTNATVPKVATISATRLSPARRSDHEDQPQPQEATTVLWSSSNEDIAVEDESVQRRKDDGNHEPHVPPKKTQPKTIVGGLESTFANLNLNNLKQLNMNNLNLNLKLNNLHLDTVNQSFKSFITTSSGILSSTTANILNNVGGGSGNTTGKPDASLEPFLPWKGEINEAEIRDEILALSRDRRNFTQPPPEGSDFKFEMKDWSATAMSNHLHYGAAAVAVPQSASAKAIEGTETEAASVVMSSLPSSPAKQRTDAADRDESIGNTEVAVAAEQTAPTNGVTDLLPSSTTESASLALPASTSSTSAAPATILTTNTTDVVATGNTGSPPTGTSDGLDEFVSDWEAELRAEIADFQDDADVDVDLDVDVEAELADVGVVGAAEQADGKA
ncbi:hypothetical protein HK102_000622 [Quaeritorhiza haematococci]|nr:hypothetical protein HK102_000622 [Quaeritorhiza haematococci]